MIELRPCSDCDDENIREVLYNKGDDFLAVLEFMEPDELSPFDLDQIELVWEISDPDGVLVTISGTDLTIEENNIQFQKTASFFDDFIYMGFYTHRLYDANLNQTYLEGKFTLQ